MRGRLAVLGAVVALLALSLVVSAAWAWRALHAPYAAFTGDHIDVELEPGMHAEAMLSRLSEFGVLERPGLTGLWLRARGISGDLRAGEYRFEGPASAAEVLELLIRGEVLLYAVTLPEGLTLVEVAERFTVAGFGPREALLEAFGDPSAIRELDSAAPDLEGYLFPDTYHFARSTPADEIASAMVRRFREVTGEAFLDAVQSSDMDLRGAVTLASMIEEETGLADERRVISSVFHNRLRKGMRLQCDPTVRYALAREGREVERLSRKDLEFDSPFNTYVIRGLPPGPITNPGLASLLAAVSPSEGDLLYFVAAPGGGHEFSPDLKSHQKAVVAWRRYSRSSR